MLNSRKIAVVVAGVVASSCWTDAARTSKDTASNRGGSLVKLVDSLCGDGDRDLNEQCDDGNVLDLDGCDSSCGFEQVLRANSLVQRFDTDAICTANAFGTSIGSAAQGSANDSLRKDVASGAISVMFKMLGLTDLSGQNAGSFLMGSVQGSPKVRPGYNGLSDLDGWYDVDPGSVDTERVPVDQLAATLENRTFVAGPGSLHLRLSMGGAPVQMTIMNSVLRGTTNSLTTPSVADGGTVGHVAEEQVDPAIASFSQVIDGTLCGDIVAESLAQTPVPPDLKVGGSASCSEKYTDDHSYLDVLVSGCTVLLVRGINKTQPDRYLGAAPAGGKYIFTKDAKKFVTGCTDGAGNAFELKHCLTHALYSSYFDYTADRVVLKMQPPVTSEDGGILDAGSL